MMPRLFVLTLALAVLALFATPAEAQNAARASTGEKRNVTASGDQQAYDTLKTQVSTDLNEVMQTAEGHITSLNASITQLTLQVAALEAQMSNLELNWQDEVDPSLMAQADTRQLGGSSIPICNAQTDELIFNSGTRRWVCVTNASACMAGQNIWR